MNELFEIAFNSASEGLVVVDSSSEIILVNKRLLELFGYQKEELIGQRIEKLVPMPKRSSHVGYRDQYMDNPHSRPMGKTGMYLEGERKDGVVFPIEVSLNYFQMNDSRYVMGLVTDITKRVEMELELKKAQDNLEKLNEELETLVVKRTRALEESQVLYQSIASNFPDGVINVVDQNMVCIFVDGMGLEKQGLKKSELKGKIYLDRFNDQTKLILENAFKRVVNGESQICFIENADQYYEVHFVSIPSSSRQRKRYLVVERNVTKQKLIEIEQAKALQKEKELGEMKSRFVSMASHEFRTPLSAILSSSSLIEKYDKTEQQENRLKHTSRIKSSVGNLTDILNDFLSFEKLNENKVEVSHEKLNMCELVQYAVEELESHRKNNQRIEFIKGEKPCVIYSDAKILKNVLLNLLSNGLKYSGNEGVVNVDFEISNGTLFLSVADNGIGIPDKDQKHLFERFHRAENVSNIQGTGLGLNIVKKYTELLGGKISFESELDKGTTFYIEIPTNE
ncbi:MAG: PAS domain-containing sensor histidine kinase [Flavobacteriales bacterium]|nr:PAS domain-containing sensor histidine kinase [Flavobacteriales bacterium]